MTARPHVTRRQHDGKAQARVVGRFYRGELVGDDPAGHLRVLPDPTALLVELLDVDELGVEANDDGLAPTGPPSRPPRGKRRSRPAQRCGRPDRLGAPAPTPRSAPDASARWRCRRRSYGHGGGGNGVFPIGGCRQWPLTRGFVAPRVPRRRSWDATASRRGALMTRRLRGGAYRGDRDEWRSAALRLLDGTNVPSAILRWTSRVDLRMSSAVSGTVSGLSASNGAEDVRTAGKACSSH